MGNEATCKATVDGKPDQGKALLEGDEIVFRGKARVAIRRAALRGVTLDGGALVVRHAGGVLSLDLGAKEAARWKDKIENPKTLVQKLGVKAGQSVAVVGELPAALASDLAKLVEPKTGAPRSPVDVVFLVARAPKDLERLATLCEKLNAKGGVWVLREKGGGAVTEAMVMAKAKEHGFVDVKVAKVDEVWTAERVVPRAAPR